MLLLKKVIQKVLSINIYLQKYLESNQFEKNLKEALNNKNYGVSNSLLYDLSISTYDVNYYKRVMTEVFKAIQEKPTRWRRIYKGLKLCEYVMKNGCEYFISDVKDKEELIKKLTHFTHLEDLKDKGIGIRDISNNILKLLKDNKYLKNERIEAAKYANICTNIESKPIEKKGFFSNRKKKKHKIKRTSEYSRRNINDPRNLRQSLQSKNILDQIQEERKSIYGYTNDDDNNRFNEKRYDTVENNHNNISSYSSNVSSSSSSSSTSSSSSSSTTSSSSSSSSATSSSSLSSHRHSSNSSHSNYKTNNNHKKISKRKKRIKDKKHSTSSSEKSSRRSNRSISNSQDEYNNNSSKLSTQSKGHSASRTSSCVSSRTSYKHSSRLSSRSSTSSSDTNSYSSRSRGRSHMRNKHGRSKKNKREKETKKRRSTTRHK
ncbi:epsin-like protein, putative [Plasmodium falciparum 3D7]|uniref:Epsin-like protein, putative n=3 Tax=Plasmodium falciparum TaxID=5833 RepID=Q8I4X4_PLAF7|nr:epsin-like protein, putative [Plasmodium falciparum 3D7]CZT99612.1 epsin-like protein, putative [Plasmodium falciparum 3D7]|eukprot:XP_001350843.2 epsin, putative [Plasmodium falciparum 3D7]